jgi:3-hydroxypropanoate dehydrogenase
MIDSNALQALFLSARSQNGWLDRPVSDEQLHQIFDVMKMAPTSMNTQPARFVFLRTVAAKERLRPTLSRGNVDKTMAAPVVVIIANDLHFHEHIPRVFPHDPGAKKMFDGDANSSFRASFAFRNASLQGAYFMLAARAFGLDVGPMSGFDTAKVDAEFFPDGRVKSNFLCCVGYGDPSKVMERLPRFAFEDVCTLL